jgi:DNA-binding MarR family transcriptional regulator
MQISTNRDAAVVLDRLVAKEVPRRGGLTAWASLLRAHATLLRQLDTELYGETGLHLADFDVLVQLALAGGALRMGEVAARALSSRSGMTRKIDGLAQRGLVCRSSDDTDARGVLVALTDRGLDRLAEMIPVHLRGVTLHFLSRLTDRELEVINRTLQKVIVDCSFG